MNAVEFQSTLAIRCKEKKIKYADLAREVGICRQTMSHYMNCVTSMPMDVALMTAHRLGLDIQIVEVKK